MEGKGGVWVYIFHPRRFFLVKLDNWILFFNLFIFVKPSKKFASVNGGYLISRNVPHVRQVLTHIQREITFGNFPLYARKNQNIISLPTCLKTLHAITDRHRPCYP
jgi:hypothetical protein